MADYLPVLKVFEADGITLSSSFPSGTIPTGAWCDYEFTLRSRKGCAGGNLSLPGHVRNVTKLSHRQFVTFYHSSGVPMYTGRVDGAARFVDGQTHEYSLRSPWADLEDADNYERIILGTEGEVEGVETIEDIVNWYIENRLEPATPYTAGTIAACAQVVASFTLEPDMSPDVVFETLADMAEGIPGTTKKWFYGITPGLEIYFLPLDPATAATIDYTIGTLADPLWAGDEQIRGRYVLNRLAIVGGIGEAADGSIRRMRRHYPKSSGSSSLWATSQAAWGRKRLRIVAAPMLKREADFDLLAEGLQARYGFPGIKIQSAPKHHMNAAPDFPWEVMGNYKDVSRGTLGGPEMIAEMSFEGGDGLISTATLGVDSEGGAGSSNYAPSLDRDTFQDQAEDFFPELIDTPEATDELPPYDQAPGADGGGDTPGSGGGSTVGLEIMDLAPWTGVRQGNSMAAIAKISNSGDALEPGDVTFHYYQYSEAAALLASNTGIGTVKQTGNGFESWTSEQIVTETDAAYVMVAVSVTRTVDETPVTVWYPADITSLPFDCILVYLRPPVSDPEDGGTILASTGWPYEGS